MTTFEITLQRQTDEGWPVIVEYSQPDTLLPIREESLLALEFSELKRQSEALAYGTVLGKALFRDVVRDTFIRAKTENPVRLRVRLHIEAPKLRDLHWERLAVPRSGRHWQLVALDQHIQFAIALASSTDQTYSPLGRRDLRALILTANPQGLADYNLADFDEAATIAGVKASLGAIPADVLGTVEGAAGLPTLNDLVAQLTEKRYAILHIVAHGQYARRRRDTLLYLADEENHVQPIPVSTIMERLSQLQQLPHFIFLATCESARPDAENAFGGFGQRLVRELGIPAVIAMSEPVSIETADLLTREFYYQLHQHGEIDRAKALATVRLAERHDVTVPALFSRLAGRPLFNDALDKTLTNSEIKFGLERIQGLFAERAPVLLNPLQQIADVLHKTTDTDATVLTASARIEWEEALQAINELSEEVLELTFNGLALGQEVPVYDNRCPFPGLNAFQDDSQAFFFGRESLIKRLVTTLEEDRDVSSNFLAVLGPSGNGKSSVILAGLIPELGLPHIRITPSYDPLPQLAVALASLTAQMGQDDRDEVVETKGRAVLVIDQFEEVFTLCPDEDQRKNFITQILNLANPERRQHLIGFELEIVVTMRADFWGECANYPALKEAMQANQELIGPMTSAQLRRAMEQQARAVGLQFEADLSQTILDEVEDEPGAMPLLQHALLELWQRRHGRWLKTAEYRAIGGVKKAISSTADALYLQLNTAEQAQVREIFPRLATLDAEASDGDYRDTRRRIRFDELVPAGEDGSATQQLVQRLADGRLLITSINPVSGEQEVEVAHEALIRHWPRFRQWRNEGRQVLQLREEVHRAAQRWRDADQEEVKNSRGSELRLFFQQGWRRLYPSFDHIQHRGSRLDEMCQFVEQGQLRLNEVEQAYLDACIYAEGAVERQWKRTVRVFALIASLAVMLAIAAVWLMMQALESAQDAQLAQQRSDQQARMAHALRASSEASEVVSSQPELAMLLAQTTLAVTRTDEAFDVLGQLYYDYPPFKYTFRYTFREHTASVRALAYSSDGQILATGSQDTTIILWSLNRYQRIQTLTGHQGTVTGLAFTPDDRWLISSSFDGQVLLWNMETDGQVAINEQSGRVNNIAVNSTGDLLATASEDHIVRIYDISRLPEQPTLLRKLIGHRDSVYGVDFNPNGGLIATGSRDETVRLWDLETGQVKSALFGHHEWVYRVKFSPDGRLLASSTTGRDVRVWDVVKNRNKYVLQEHTDQTLAISFSPDSSRLATGSKDRKIILWDMASGEVDDTYQGHSAEVRDLAFSPTGELASTGHDRKTILWDVELPLSSIELSGHTRSVRSIDFSSDGRYLVSGGTDQRALVWDLETDELIEELKDTGWLLDVAFSPDDTLVAGASADEHVVLWDLETQERQVPFPHDDSVQSVDFSPDGQWLASASFDKTLVIWDMETLTRTHVLTHDSGFLSTEFNTDGTLVAGSTQDGPILIWETERWQPMQQLTEHTDWVYQITFNDDGSQIASASSDGWTRVWDVATGENTHAFHFPGSWIFTVAFSPGNQHLVVGGNDQAITKIDLTTGQIYRRLFGHEDDVWQVAYHPDGSLLASGSADTLVHLISTDLINTPTCDLVTRNLTMEEWRDYFDLADLGYIRTCPNWPIPDDVIEFGRDLARQGKIPQAEALFQNLIEQDSQLGIDPKQEAQFWQNQRIQELQEEGRRLARTGNITDAAAVFNSINDIVPFHILLPQAEAEQLRHDNVFNLVQDGLQLARSGAITVAIAKFEEAEGWQMSGNYDLLIGISFVWRGCSGSRPRWCCPFVIRQLRWPHRILIFITGGVSRCFSSVG